MTVTYPLEGGCDCRTVRYRMETAPLFVHCCNCRWCQRESGASFALNAMIEVNRVTLLGAAPHLNPLRSGIVRSIDEQEEYLWTGHRRIVRGGFPEWQDTDLLREEFGDGVTKNGWLEAYREFLCFASDYKVEGEVIPPAGQESLQDDRMDNHGSRERFSEIVNRISARRGVAVEEVLGGDRRYDAVDVRRKS